MAVNTQLAAEFQNMVPHINTPLETMGALMQQRALVSEIALRNAQAQQSQANTADIQAQAQQRQRDLQSTQKLQTVLADPAAQKSMAGGDYTPVWNAGISPNVANPFIEQHQKMAQTAQTLRKGQSEFYAGGRQLLQSTIEGLDPSDDARAAQQFNGALSVIGKEHPELAQQLPQLSPSSDFRQKISDIAASNGVARAILENQAALENKQAGTKKESAEASAATAKAGLETAETPGATAESQKKQLVTQAMQSALANPQAGAAAIDQAIPASLDPQINASYKAAWQAAMASGNPEAAAHVVAAAAGHAATLVTPGNPVMQAGKVSEAKAMLPIEVNKAVATERATAPLKTAQAVATQQALNAGSGAALASVPPHLVPAATSAYAKSGEALAGAQASAAEMQDIINLARGGNKVAYAYAPTTGVLTINTANGVKRVNMAEIGSYQGAGSLLDKIKGYLGKQATGASIPADVLDDMEKLHGTVAQVAAQKHAQEVQVINKTYGAKFEPIKLGGGAPSASGGAGAKVYSQADVDAAVQAHPGLTAAQADAAFKAKGWAKQ